MLDPDIIRGIERVTGETYEPGTGGCIMQCSYDQGGMGGCNFPVTWIIKGADKRRVSCSRHLNQVCLALVNEGLEYMTVSITE